MNIWAGIILAALAAGVYGLSKLKHAGDNLTTETRGRVHSIDFQNITFAVDAILKNPSQTLLTIQYPFIQISYKGNLLASSNLVNSKIDIKPMTQTAINGIKLPVSLLKIAGMGGEIAAKLKDKKQKITLQVTVITQVNVGGTMVPYKQTSDVSF